MNYIILIPAFEPDENLIVLLKKINKQYDTVVVNDGSSPACAQIFQEASLFAHVISYEENHGKGYALKTGLAYIRDHFRDYIVVTMDSDGQHLMEDALKLCEAAQKDRHSLILGRRTWDKDMPIRSRLGNAITRTTFRFITGQKIFDTQTGLRAFSEDLMSYMLGIKGERYEYEMNVLLNLKQENITVKEIPIETIYYDNNKGSHFNVIRDSFTIYKEIFLFALSSISSFVIDYVLYASLVFLKFNVTAANIMARMVSALYNYNMNKRVVFKTDKKSTFFQYVVLVAAILVLNTIILNFFIHAGLNKYLAKVLTELALFTVSYIIQKKLIF